MQQVILQELKSEPTVSICKLESISAGIVYPLCLQGNVIL